LDNASAGTLQSERFPVAAHQSAATRAMNPHVNRHDLLPAEVPFALLAGLALLSAVLWALAIRTTGGPGPERPLSPAALTTRFLRIALGATFFWLLWQTLGRVTVLETAWPLWGCAALGGCVAEILLSLYRYERRFVPPARGRTLTLLRLGALATLLVILVQPVFSRMRARDISREVIVLVDDSESMQLVDQQHTLTDQLAVAALFAPEALSGRPDLQPILRSARSWQAEIARQRQALAPPEGTTADAAALQALVQGRAGSLAPFLDGLLPKLAPTADRIAAASSAARGDDAAMNLLRDLERPFREQLPRALAEARRQTDAGNHLALSAQLQAAEDQLAMVLRQLPPVISRLDEVYHRNLSEADRTALAQAAARPRSEIARQILRQRDGEGRTVADVLQERYTLRFVRFGNDHAEFDGAAWLEGAPLTPEKDTDRFRQTTDLAAALEGAMAKVPAEALGGVLLLSDGRHNAEVPPEDAARQLGSQGSPLCAIALGSRIGPRDASVLRVLAPQSLYLGDRIGVRAEVKLDGLQGKKIRARLLAGGVPVAEETIQVPEAQYRTELRFAHAPPEKGILDYTVELEETEGELFDHNNRWEFKCAVTDDRTNVLIVDSFPRWEFRYLRNLFYGRDKSVHLQYVLLNPDRITGQDDRPSVPASAARPFGEAEATRLPESEAEWRKFDAVILGDVPPAALDDATWRTLRKAVSERGTLLVFVAGPRYFPHEHRHPVLAELLPVVPAPADGNTADATPFRFELTQAGQSSPILQQSLSGTVNRQIWAGIPSLPWRSLPGAIKESAEVLAYAVPESGTAVPDGDTPFNGNPEEVEAALRQLARQKELEQENALLVAHRFGLGRVVLLNFDSTWRFRYGVGDTHHHKFWGQLLRWGTGENLRSGGEYVRLGTDQLSYSPNAPIKVSARILDRNLQPVTGGGVHVSLYRGDQRLQRRPLTYRPGSNGMFDGELDPIAVEGEYRLELDGGPVVRARQESGLASVDTPLIISRARGSAEYAELTADHDSLAQWTQLGGGALASVTDAHGLLDRFGSPKETVQERVDTPLWDQWPLLTLFLGLLGTEWILRRQAGLS
jgi:hypothetical protein